jgi:hypothetical protein
VADQPGPVPGRYLSFTEREEIAILRARGCGVREIARRAGRSGSAISRELRRNAATRGGCLEYRATTAQWHADRRARRPKVAKLAVNKPLRRYVEDRLSGAVRHTDRAANFSRRFDRRIARAKVPEITVHGARKTCGSLLATLDVHPHVAMQILRHSKIALMRHRDSLSRDARRSDEAWAVARRVNPVAALCCCTKIQKGRSHDRNRPVSWSPVTESNRRPSPYHKYGFAHCAC